MMNELVKTMYYLFSGERKHAGFSEELIYAITLNFLVSLLHFTLDQNDFEPGILVLSKVSQCLGTKSNSEQIQRGCVRFSALFRLF